MTELAIEKLRQEKKAATYSRYAAVMKDSVFEALVTFCRQNREFAQAVYQGSSFGDCMKAVSKNCGSAISDLEAYRRAVQFYFKGADIQFNMTINLCAEVEAAAGIVPETAAKQTGKILHLDLDDFL